MDVFSLNGHPFFKIMPKREIFKRYFPHTEKCPKNDSICIKDRCNCWIDDKHCWLVDFDSFVDELLGEGASHFGYHFKISEYDSISIHTYFYHDNPISVNLDVTLNSERLAEAVHREIGESWTLTPQCYDGSDDYALIKTIDGSYKNKVKIGEEILFLKSFLPRIIEIDKRVNTCEVCRIKRPNLDEYGKRAICGFCAKKIIEDHVESYVPEK